jgi:hypothetical protein
MRVRIITQTLAELWRARRLMNPVRGGFYAVQLWSHKALRYLVPLFLLVTLLSAARLATESAFYAGVLMAQLCFYSAAPIGWSLDRAGASNRLFVLPQYFVLANLASVIAFYKLLKGERYARWEPTRGTVRAGSARRRTVPARSRGRVM